LGQRSRKRGQRQRTASSTVAVKTPATGRSRDRTGAAAGSRSAARDAALRSALQPFEAGERPWPIVVGAILAALAGGVQLVLFLAGVKLKVAGTHAAAGSTIAFAVLMFVCAIGMWLMRYWAVLGFMALLAIAVVNFSLALVKVSSLLGLGIAVAGVLIPGFLFFKLVKVLGRLQSMPRFPGS
jgi:hypothetical protein